MALIQEIHRRLRIEVQAKLVGKYGKGINEIILNQRQDEAGINMMANANLLFHFYYFLFNIFHFLSFIIF